MKILSLLYHDVVPPGRHSSSGFPGADAEIYKLDENEFERHLDAVAIQAASYVQALDGQAPVPGHAVLLTFDDGGISALERTAPLLEARGWRGHFFITTDYIGEPAFLTAHQIRELRRRGHIIGSHSCTHPPRMSHCPLAQMQREWSESTAILSGIIGEPVYTGSVPGGFYSPGVADAAKQAGIRLLFTSEPVAGVTRREGIVILGRYSIQQGTTAALAGKIAAGAVVPRLQQFLFWNAKKMAKRLGGEKWLRFRRAFFARRSSTQ